MKVEMMALVPPLRSRGDVAQRQGGSCDAILMTALLYLINTAPEVLFDAGSTRIIAPKTRDWA
jgi:hypothetical protein